jgi:hypothetical protein
MEKQKEIAEHAYYIWERKGCPEGVALDCWLEAETELATASVVREHMKGRPQSQHRKAA